MSFDGNASTSNKFSCFRNCPDRSSRGTLKSPSAMVNRASKNTGVASKYDLSLFPWINGARLVVRLFLPIGKNPYLSLAARNSKCFADGKPEFGSIGIAPDSTTVMSADGEGVSSSDACDPVLPLPLPLPSDPSLWPRLILALLIMGPKCTNRAGSSPHSMIRRIKSSITAYSSGSSFGAVAVKEVLLPSNNSSTPASKLARLLLLRSLMAGVGGPPVLLHVKFVDSSAQARKNQ
mmetsp:Transcript_27349/g.65591  ORF Transcript_27349/g.65591 Transcript_27349/m.65591 type:complete len:235 (+) Transcript_27349:3023-3727(+)